MVEFAPAILVVDDEYLIATMIRDALVDAGFEVGIAADALEAISILKGDGNAAAWRALVTDINGLGDMDGWG
ncbi:hypothetical protein [Bradyrhizobium sp. 62]|uniref:hypothetical protein n=1 Tax=Bradyrhizobium sp. 62 TaxID=1043588 RepID=UPI003211B338